MGGNHLSWRSRIVGVGLVLVLAAGSGAQEPTPELLVEIDRDELYEGESLRYSVTLNHVEKPQPPTLEGFDDFVVRRLGEQNLSSRQVTIINGRRNEIVRNGRMYQFELQPKRAGEFTIPAPQAVVNGMTLSGREIAITVIAPDEQDLVQLGIDVDRDSVYPMQPFNVSLRIRVRALPPPVQDRDPVSILRQFNRTLPALTIPWVNDETLPEGLSPRKNWKDWIGDYRGLRRDGGFTINGLVSQGVFAFDTTEVAFLPESERVDQLVDGKPMEYVEYTIDRDFYATRVGRFEFGPTNVKGRFLSDVVGGRAQLQPVFALARAVSVTVRDVPSEGRPANYVNAIGKFQLESSLQPLRARVGDPLTLKLTFRGTGTLESIREPDLAGIPEVASSFRIHEATTETDRDSRTFTYSLRPTSVDIDQFPAVSVSVFDYEQEKYVELVSAPISLEIQDADRLDDDQIVVSGGTGRSNGPLQQNENGLFGNITDPDLIVDESVNAERWFVSIGLLVAAVGAVSVGERRRQSRQHRRPGRRELESQLASASDRLSQVSDARDRASVIAAALNTLLGGLNNDAAGCMTAEELRAALRHSGCPTELVDDLSLLMADCEAARFGVVDGVELTSERLERIGGRLIAELYRRKRAG